MARPQLRYEFSIRPPYAEDDTGSYEAVTVRVAVPEDPAKPAPPEYVPVTVSAPTGAVVAPQAATPPERTALQRVFLPVVKVTFPVGVPVPDCGVTVTK
jgi:hypothetical protein